MRYFLLIIPSKIFSKVIAKTNAIINILREKSLTIIYNGVSIGDL